MKSKRIEGFHVVLGLDLNDSTVDGDAARTIESWGMMHSFKSLFPDLEFVGVSH